jgi:starch phosphorylase
LWRARAGKEFDFQLFDIGDYARAAEAYRQVQSRTRMSILNPARTDFFSSDRTRRQDCAEIWRVKPVKIEAT